MVCNGQLSNISICYIYYIYDISDPIPAQRWNEWHNESEVYSVGTGLSMDGVHSAVQHTNGGSQNTSSQTGRSVLWNNCSPSLVVLMLSVRCFFGSTFCLSTGHNHFYLFFLFPVYLCFCSLPPTPTFTPSVSLLTPASRHLFTKGQIPHRGLDSSQPPGTSLCTGRPQQETKKNILSFTFCPACTSGYLHVTNRVGVKLQ